MPGGKKKNYASKKDYLLSVYEEKVNVAGVKRNQFVVGHRLRREPGPRRGIANNKKKKKNNQVLKKGGSLQLKRKKIDGFRKGGVTSMKKRLL